MRRAAAAGVLIGLLAASGLSLAATGAQAQGGQPKGAAEACGTKTGPLMQATGLTYTTHNPTTWSLDLKRDNVGTIKVIISCGSDIVVVFVILAKKAGIQKTPQFYEAMARANHDYDFVKIELDRDGDLAVRIDLRLRVIDTTELKTAIDQVANTCNELYPKVSAFVKR